MNQNSPGYFVLIVAFISLLTSLLTTWLNNTYQQQRADKQWTQQQEAEKEKLLREKLYESYTKCIVCLTKFNTLRKVPIKVDPYFHGEKPLKEDIEQGIKNHAEVQEYLVFLLLNYLVNEDKEFEEFENLVNWFILTSDSQAYSPNSVWSQGNKILELKNKIVELMRKDPRLKVAQQVLK